MLNNKNNSISIIRELASKTHIRDTGLRIRKHVHGCFETFVYRNFENIHVYEGTRLNAQQSEKKPRFARDLISKPMRLLANKAVNGGHYVAATR